MEVGINVSAKLQGYRQAVEMPGKLIVKFTRAEFMGSPNFKFPSLFHQHGQHHFYQSASFGAVGFFTSVGDAHRRGDVVFS